jgi:glucosylceramidase
MRHAKCVRDFRRCEYVRPLMLLVLAITIGACSLTIAQEVKLVVSSKAGDRLSAKPSLKFEQAKPADAAGFRIDPAATDQKMAGFGASLLEAGLICINDLPAQEQESVLRALFDPIHGAGFSAMKTVLACTDFMSAGPWYTYDDTPGDVDMKHFSIERDLGPNGQITFIKRARKYGNFVLQAPMDYPPDWMLVEPNDRKKQDVDPKYFDALALYYLRYLQEYEKQGVFIDYLSLFNEPSVYTKIPFTKIRDLLKDHVAPLLAKHGIKTQLMPCETLNRKSALENFPIVMDDPEARKHVAVLSYHAYDFGNRTSIAELHRRYPDVPLWMTEVCYAYQAGTPKTKKLPCYDFEDGAFWGDQIVTDLESGASAWIYWNMITDQNGGPWAISPVHGNPDPNVQHPVVIINRQTKEVTYTGCYYYLAHFSKFVRPGAVRLKTTGSQDGVRCVAFQTPEKGMVAQLLNSRDEDTEVSLTCGDRVLRVKLPAISITTCQWEAASRAN